MSRYKLLKINVILLVLLSSSLLVNADIDVPHKESDPIDGNLYYNDADTHGWYGCSISSLWVTMNYTDPDNRELYVKIYETPPDDDDDKTTLWSGYLEDGESSGSVIPTEHYHVWVVIKNTSYAEWVYYEGYVVRWEY